MFGTLYSSSSDLSSLSHARDLFAAPGFCLEQHETAIEERYCPNQHFANGISDGEWDLLLAHEARLYDSLQRDDSPALTYHEHQPLFYPEELTLHYSEEQPQLQFPATPSSPTSKPQLALLDTGYAADTDTDPGVPPLTPSPTTSTFSGDVYDLPPTPVSTTFPDPTLSQAQSQTLEQSKSMVQGSSSSRKRTRASGKANMPRKRLCRASSSTSVSTVSSLASSSSAGASIAGLSVAPITSANAPLRMPDPNSLNPWKCPHCTWVQHTKRLPDFLRHQRSHFVSESDWPCPNPKCGKGFARKDSLKRHLDNRATGCKRPPGYTVC